MLNTIYKYYWLFINMSGCLQTLLPIYTIYKRYFASTEVHSKTHHL